MDQVTKALSAAELAAIDARKSAAEAPKPTARQLLPEGIEAERRITLAVPIEFGEMVYREVSIRRLKGRDFLKYMNHLGGQDGNLLCLVTGLPLDVIDEMDIDDIENVMEAAQDFLPRGLREAADTTSDDGRSSQL